VSNLHGIVTSFLQNTSELIYFNFNEALFKPFEHLVRLEICDQAIQDQVRSPAFENGFSKWSNPGLFFLYFSFFNTVDSKYLVINKIQNLHNTQK